MADALRIQRETTGEAAGVVMLYLDDPATPVTVLDRGAIARLDAALDEIERDRPAGVVIATSHGRVYVAGADLAEIADLSDSELDAYLAEGQRVLGRIAALPCRTVAAINGAALGGGLELALHCDTLIAQEPEKPDKPYQIGLPEASLGLCPGWGGTNTLPARIEPGLAIGATACGSTFSAFEAREHGLVEALSPTREALHAEARRLALRRKPERTNPGEPLNAGMPDVAPRVRTALDRVRGDLPDADAARAVAGCVEAGLTGGWREALAHERASLIRLRSTRTARARIKAFFDRTSSR